MSAHGPKRKSAGRHSVDANRDTILVMSDATSPSQSQSRHAGRGRFASALASRDLRTLIAAFIVDGSASWAYTIVLTAYVFERTGSPGWVTALATAKWISAMVFGAYGGLLARSLRPAHGPVGQVPSLRPW